MVELTDLERDALTELVNMGVGRAATHLSRMVNDQVLLSVPTVDIVSRQEASDFLTARERHGLVAVEQQFQGSFDGRAMLIFPEANSLELARAVLGGELTLAEIVDLEQDALAEIGNIILNGCLASLSNLIGGELLGAVPGYGTGAPAAVIGSATDPVLFVRIDMALAAGDASGHALFLLDIASLDAFREAIRRALAGL